VGRANEVERQLGTVLTHQQQDAQQQLWQHSFGYFSCQKEAADERRREIEAMRAHALVLDDNLASESQLLLARRSEFAQVCRQRDAMQAILNGTQNQVTIHTDTAPHPTDAALQATALPMGWHAVFTPPSQPISATRLREEIRLGLAHVVMMEQRVAVTEWEVGVLAYQQQQCREESVELRRAFAQVLTVVQQRRQVLDRSLATHARDLMHKVATQPLPHDRPLATDSSADDAHEYPYDEDRWDDDDDVHGDGNGSDATAPPPLASPPPPPAGTAVEAAASNRLSPVPAATAAPPPPPPPPPPPVPTSLQWSVVPTDALLAQLHDATQLLEAAPIRQPVPAPSPIVAPPHHYGGETFFHGDVMTPSPARAPPAASPFPSPPVPMAMTLDLFSPGPARGA
jgi:hypothetical protein